MRSAYFLLSLSFRYVLFAMDKTYRLSGIPVWNVHASDGSGVSSVRLSICLCLPLALFDASHSFFNFILPYPSLWHITPTQPHTTRSCTHSRITLHYNYLILFSSFLFFSVTLVSNCLGCVSCRCLCVLFTSSIYVFYSCLPFYALSGDRKSVV